jgi:hypothetical protein
MTGPKKEFSTVHVREFYLIHSLLDWKSTKNLVLPLESGLCYLNCSLVWRDTDGLNESELLEGGGCGAGPLRVRGGGAGPPAAALPHHQLLLLILVIAAVLLVPHHHIASQEQHQQHHSLSCRQSWV